MQSINVNSSNADHAHAAVPERFGNDYLDLALPKEIALWFEKNASTNEPINKPAVQRPPDVINLGYNN
jgi:hypothetical protein